MSTMIRTRARLQVASARARLKGRQVAHFLHPGKTAGTAVKFALHDAPKSSRFDVLLHTHGVRMIDLPRRDLFFFVVRDPVDRFVSGFSSRQRQGRPRHNTPWTPDERRAFERFDTPQALADALGSTGTERAAAVDAMGSIQHVRSSYWYWFGDEAAFARRADRVLFVGFQESLDDQLPVLAERLGLPGLQVPADDVKANRSTAARSPLTDDARAVVADWFAADYRFMAMCRDIAEVT
jgi:hypothetical protein